MITNDAPLAPVKYIDGVVFSQLVGGLLNNQESIMKFLVNMATPQYTCLRPPGAAGALLIPSWADNIMMGYVEPAPCMPSCKELNACEMEDGHCVRTIHAEVAAIINAARYGTPTVGGTMYSLLKPCYQCAKVIAAAGINTVYYAGVAYDQPRTRLVFEMNGITVVHVDVGLGYGQDYHG